MGSFAGILAAAAAIVGAWYFYSTIWSSLGGGDSKQLEEGKKLGALMGRASDLEASESKLSARLERRQLQPIFEISHTVSRIPGKIILQCQNAGGVAKNVTLQPSGEFELYMSPTSIAPDTEVHFTFSGFSPEDNFFEFGLQYADASSTSRSGYFRYDKDASHIKEISRLASEGYQG